MSTPDRLTALEHTVAALQQTQTVLLAAINAQAEHLRELVAEIERERDASEWWKDGGAENSQ